ncbi:MAG: hypothetical protein H0W33_02590 [Gammaproteobacteria bacterium]|nr:hypothetical protein [Gammaproteobacteria bacterium]
MASEDTLIGNEFRFQVGDGASPEVFVDMCAVFDFGAVGEEKPLVDVTTLCDNARTYRNGLADGVEIPLQVNFIPGDAQIAALYADYKANTIRNFQVVTTDSPADMFQFAATIRAWKLGAPIGERSNMSFTLKISGEVVWV